MGGWVHMYVGWCIHGCVHKCEELLGWRVTPCRNCFLFYVINLLRSQRFGSSFCCRLQVNGWQKPNPLASDLRLYDVHNTQTMVKLNKRQFSLLVECIEETGADNWFTSSVDWPTDPGRRKRQPHAASSWESWLEQLHRSESWARPTTKLSARGSSPAHRTLVITCLTVSWTARKRTRDGRELRSEQDLPTLLQTTYKLHHLKHSENIRLDGGIILKWILKRKRLMSWIGFIWSREQRWDLVNTVIKCLGSTRAGQFH